MKNDRTIRCYSVLHAVTAFYVQFMCNHGQLIFVEQCSTLNS